MSYVPIDDGRAPDARAKLTIFRIGNIASLSVLFGATVAALLSDPNMLDIGNAYPTYISPAIVFVEIFLAVLLPLLFGFAFYAQFDDTPTVQRLVLEGVSWYFVASNLLMTCWLWAWMRESFLASLICSLLNTVVLSRLHQNIESYFPPSAIPETLFTKVVAFFHTPFSMYSAFILLNTLQMAFTVFPDENKVSAAAAGIWALAFIGLAWVIMGLWSQGRRDGVFGATIAWILLAVAVQQRDSVFLWAQAAGLAILELLVIVITWWLVHSRI